MHYQSPACLLRKGQKAPVPAERRSIAESAAIKLRGLDVILRKRDAQLTFCGRPSSSTLTRVLAAVPRCVLTGRLAEGRGRGRRGRWGALVSLTSFPQQSPVLRRFSFCCAASDLVRVNVSDLPAVHGPLRPTAHVTGDPVRSVGCQTARPLADLPYVS